MPVQLRAPLCGFPSQVAKRGAGRGQASRGGAYFR